MPEVGQTVGEQPRTATTWIERASLLVVLGVVCVIFWAGASSRPPWMDELYSYFAVHHGSLGDLYRASMSGRNIMPFGVVIVYWVVDLVSGGSMLAGRMLSLASGLGTIVVVYQILRRYIDGAGAAAICLIALVTTAEFQFHLYEYRFYGFKLFLAAVCTLWYLTYADAAVVSRRQLLVNALLHAMLIQTAVTAVPYTGMFLVVAVACDIVRRRWRPWVYGSFVLGGMSTIAVLPVLASHFTPGAEKPIHLGKPTLGALKTLYDPGIALAPVATAVVVLLLLLATWMSRRQTPADAPPDAPAAPAWTPPLPVIALAAAFLLVPVVFWGVSQVKSLWLARYMMPVSIGWCLLLGILYRAVVTPYLQRLAVGGRGAAALSRLAVTGCVVLPFAAYGLLAAKDLRSGQTVNHALMHAAQSAEVQALATAADPAADAPIVIISDTNLYLLLRYYNPEAPVVFVCDEATRPHLLAYYPRGRFMMASELAQRGRRIVHLEVKVSTDWILQGGLVDKWASVATELGYGETERQRIGGTPVWIVEYAPNAAP